MKENHITEKNKRFVDGYILNCQNNGKPNKSSTIDNKQVALKRFLILFYILDKFFPSYNDLLVIELLVSL
jgi:hypothetical protein